MNAIDTNVLLYFVDSDEPVKQARCAALLNRLVSEPIPTVWLWQVAVEFGAGLRRWQNKGKLTETQVASHWQRAEATLPILVVPKSNLVPAAFDLSRQYSLSYWDALLLAGCIEAGVDTLYSEDLTHGARYLGVR